MSYRTIEPPRHDNRKTIDDEALELTLRALVLVDAPSTAQELSRAIREHFEATTSTSRIYVAIGVLWERGHVTVAPVPIRHGGRSTRQTLVTITPRGRSAVAALLEAIAEEELSTRSARSAGARSLALRRQ
jgi:DNA-binding PadR family transcriptional regulator